MYEERPVGDRPITQQSLIRFDSTDGTVPLGGILLWSGAEADIPMGWQLCDGTNGTPNLQNKFIVGAGGTYAVGATAGATTHTHGSHSHTNNHSRSTDVAISNHATHVHSGVTDNGDDPVHRDTAGSGLNAQSMTHQHSFTTYSNANTSGSYTHTVSTQPQFSAHGDHSHDSPSHLPPYYALCYIMRMA